MLRARALPRSIRSTRASATASRRGYTDTAAHNASILDQFTRQAVPFSQAAGITSEESLTRIIEFSGVGADDTLLDVACGPGILACAFARTVRHATGIDMTPAMLARARTLQEQTGLKNLTWLQGDATKLPFPDHSFSIISTRFVFHHLLKPLDVLKEMKRVCAPGGKVLVVDSAPSADKADAFNRSEKLRDPSHVRAMPLAELQRLFADAQLPIPRTYMYRMAGDLDDFLARSFPLPGDGDKMRKMVEEALSNDFLDMQPKRVGDKIVYGIPVAVLVADNVHKS